MALENISNVSEVCSGMLRIVPRELHISKFSNPPPPLPTNNVSKSVWLDLSPKDYQNRGDDTKNYKIVLGENPPLPNQPIRIQWIS